MNKIEKEIEENYRFDEVFAKICDDKDKRSGERLWYLRVDDAEKMLKKVFKKEKTNILKAVIEEIEEVALLQFPNNETTRRRIINLIKESIK